MKRMHFYSFFKLSSKASKNMQQLKGLEAKLLATKKELCPANVSFEKEIQAATNELTAANDCALEKAKLLLIRTGFMQSEKLLGGQKELRRISALLNKFVGQWSPGGCKHNSVSHFPWAK